MPVGCAEGSVCFSQFTEDIWQTETGEEVSGVGDLTTPGGIISAVWPYAFGIAGLILFAMLVWGALQIQFGALDTKSVESGKKRITNAVIGFILLFVVFWMGQLLQQIFGLNFGVGTQVGFEAPLDNSGNNGGGGGDNGEDEEEMAPATSYVSESVGVLSICLTSQEDFQYNATGTMSISRDGTQIDSRSFTMAILAAPQGSTDSFQCYRFNAREYAAQASTDELTPLVPGLTTFEGWEFISNNEGNNVFRYILQPLTGSNTEEERAAINAAMSEMPEYQLFFDFSVPGQNVSPVRVYIQHAP